MTIGPDFIFEDFKSVFSSSGEYAEPVVITYDGTTYPDETGIFDDTFEEIDAETGMAMASEYSRLTMDENTVIEILGQDILTSEEIECVINVRGVDYGMYRPERDGQGLILMNLKAL